MLHTRFTELFGLEYPVMSAPMAMHSGGTLAAAVSTAGGMGSFGGIHAAQPPEWVTAQAAQVRAATDAPYGIGFITQLIQYMEPYFNAALDARPDVIALSFSDPGPWAERVRAAGCRLVCQVQTLEDGDLAVAAGAEVLVAQGTEAGGHTGTMALLPLLAAIADRHPDVPLLAAGGIGNGRTFAAALLAGADGAWLGTPFLATREAVEIDDSYKEAIVHSNGGDTVWTHAYDIASGVPWPPGIGERVRRDSFTDEWGDREAELREHRAEVSAGVPLRYGQSAAFVDGIRTAADVVHGLCEDAERILRERPASLL